MTHSREHYERLRAYCFYRAFKNTTPHWRKYWFNLYEVADQMVVLFAKVPM